MTASKHCSSVTLKVRGRMDVFSRQSDGTSVSEQYRRVGIRLSPANMDRIAGWWKFSRALAMWPLAAPAAVHSQALPRLLDCIPAMQHDPNRPEDVLKVDADEEGVGGDDAADALRYLIATKSNKVYVRKLVGL